ncbi:MAG: GspE/PulE family protein [Holophagales bacterium]|nr:GspE/PulE family protein [Holophagales bacterium]
MSIGLRSVQLLTAVIVLAGLLSMWEAYRPADRREALGILSAWSRSTAGQPWVWVWASLFALASFLARRFEAAADQVLPGTRTHRIDLPGSSVESGDAIEGGSERLKPITSPGREQRRLDLLRIRLEAFLRGEADVRAFVDELLGAAVELGASDVHLEPTEGDTRSSFRRRGQLGEVARIPRQKHADVVRRLKVMAGLPPYVSDRPADGQLRLEVSHGETKVGGRERDGVQVRVATVPTVHGEKVALRLAGDARHLDLGDLGLLDDQLGRVRELLRRPQGLILLTGPTGSGKTTTLYSALGHIHAERGDRAQLASIEDPVEVDLPFVNQVQVDRSRDLGFASALRSLLRQDPNVLMVGEIRDGETARVAVQAGLSGHLVLSTLHAESAVGVFPRLIDLGVEPFLAASATLASLGQRLLRRLCPQCRHRRSLEPELARRLAGRGLTFGAEPWIAEGCSDCAYRGFTGRLAVFEILELDGELRRAITQRIPTTELEDRLVERRHDGLAASGMRLAERGEISLEELLGIAP